MRSSSKLSLLNEINRRKEAQSKAGPQSVSNKSKGSEEIKRNSGILKRLQKDELAYATLDENDATGHHRQSILLAKAKLYEKLRKGDTAGLSPAQRASLPVDFDAKANQEWDDAMQKPPESESEDESEDDVVPTASGSSVEVVDEFGRARMVSKADAEKMEAARPIIRETDTQESSVPDFDNAIYGEQTDFPIYEPSPEELKARHRAQGTLDDVPLFKHYDASAEVRARGAAQFTFSQDADERKAQQDAIKNMQSEVASEKIEIQVQLSAKDRQMQDRKALLADKKRKLLESRAQKSQAALADPTFVEDGHDNAKKQKLV